MILKVIYDAKGKIDTELDEKILKAFKGFGLVFYGSGCNRINGERDLVFDTKK